MTNLWKILMKDKLFIRNPLRIIFLTAFISSLLLLLLYGITLLEKRVEKKMIDISIFDVISIAKNDVLDFEIPLPSLEQQQKVINVLALLDEEIALTNKILEKKNALKKGVLNELITNKTEF